MASGYNVTPVDSKKRRRGRPHKTPDAPAKTAPAVKNGNGLDTRAGLGAELWKAADILRGAVSPDKYDVYILPLLFYKRLSDVYVDEYKRALDEVELLDDQVKIRTCGELNPMTVLKRWMTEQTKERAESIQLKHSLESPAHLRIVDTARWGYVRERTIHINNQLITLPPRLQEFIIIHEHLHLQHMNHGASFQVKLREKIPDYPLREQELSKYIALNQNELSK